MVDEEFEDIEEIEEEEELEEEGVEEEAQPDRFPEALLITATGCLILAIILIYYTLGSYYGVGLFKSAYVGIQ